MGRRSHGIDGSQKHNPSLTSLLRLWPWSVCQRWFIIQIYLKCCPGSGHSDRLYHIMKKRFFLGSRDCFPRRFSKLLWSQFLSFSVTLEVSGVTGPALPWVSEHSPLPAELPRLQGSSDFTVLTFVPLSGKPVIPQFNRSDGGAQEPAYQFLPAKIQANQSLFW